MATKKTDKYLLLLKGPVNAIPVGLYDTPEDAVKAAAEWGIPADATYLTDSDLEPRIDATGFTYHHLGADANKKPCGYVVVKFEGNRPENYAIIEPFDGRDYVLPSEKDTTEIDPDQELSF